MKLKRLLSGVTAAIMALSSIAVASFTTASAANDPIKPTNGWYVGEGGKADEGTLEGAQLKLIQQWDANSKFPAIQNKTFYVAFEVTGVSADTTAYIALSNGNDVQAWEAGTNNPAISTPKDGKYVVSFTGNTSDITQFMCVCFKKAGADDYDITSAKLIGCYLEDPSEELGIGGSEPTPTDPDPVESTVVYEEDFTTGSRANTLYLDGSKFASTDKGDVTSIIINSKMDPSSGDTYNTTLQVEPGNVTIGDENTGSLYNDYQGGMSTREDTIKIKPNTDLSNGISIGGYNIVITSVAVTYGKVEEAPTTPVTPGTGYNAFLMYCDSQFSWGNWNAQAGGSGYGVDALVTGDGTYTVGLTKESIAANENGANKNFFETSNGYTAVGIGNCLNVDITGILKAEYFDAEKEAGNGVTQNGTYSESDITCELTGIEQDGKAVEFDPSKVLYGNLEDDNTNYRIEIFNNYGDTKDDPPISDLDIEFSDSLMVTFKIAMKKAPVNPSNPTNPSVNNPTKTPTKATAPTKATRSKEAVAKDKAAAQKLMKQAKIKKLTVKSKAKKKITVTWKKVKKAKGYEVEVNTNKKFKKSKKVLSKLTSKKKLVIKNKKIKSGKKYYVRVRAYATYKNANNTAVKVYSKWNKQLRTVKVK